MYKPFYKRINLGERFDSHMASWDRGTDLGLSLDGVAVTSRRLGLGSNLFLGISLACCIQSFACAHRRAVEQNSRNWMS